MPMVSISKGDVRALRPAILSCWQKYHQRIERYVCGFERVVCRDVLILTLYTTIKKPEFCTRDWLSADGRVANPLKERVGLVGLEPTTKGL